MMKNLALVSFTLALVLGGLWLIQGKHMGTLTEKAVRTVSTDDFGDEVETITWQETLEIGLDVVIPGIGGFGLLGVGLLLLSNPVRKKIAMVALALGAFGLLGSVASLVMAFVG
jgi:hypothetical protein